MIRCPAAIVAIGLLLTYPGCGPDRVRHVTPDDLRNCSKKMRITFPASTRPIAIQESHGMDDAIRLKVEIDRGDLDGFINGCPIPRSALRSDRKLVHPDGRQWREIRKINKFLSGEAWLPNGEALHILIGLDAPDVVVVYLDWIET
jgi:hypothetical protein